MIIIAASKTAADLQGLQYNTQRNEKLVYRCSFTDKDTFLLISSKLAAANLKVKKLAVIRTSAAQSSLVAVIKWL